MSTDEQGPDTTAEIAEKRIKAVLALHVEDRFVVGPPHRCAGCGHRMPCPTRKALGRTTYA